MCTYDSTRTRTLTIQWFLRIEFYHPIVFFSLSFHFFYHDFSHEQEILDAFERDQVYRVSGSAIVLSVEHADVRGCNAYKVLVSY